MASSDSKLEEEYKPLTLEIFIGEYFKRNKIMKYKDLFIEFCTYDYMSKDDQIKFNKKICELIPFLIPKNRWTGKVDDEYDYTYTEIDMAEVPFGWKYLCFLEAIDIQEQLEKENSANEFYIQQWKEKYNELRCYTSACTNDVYDIISIYEHLAYYICIYCGKPNSPVSKGYYIYSACEDCFNDHEKYNSNYSSNFDLLEDHMMPKTLTYTSYSNDKNTTHKLDLTGYIDKINEAFELWDIYHNRGSEEV